MKRECSIFEIFLSCSPIKYLFKLFYIYIVTDRTIPAYVAEIIFRYRDFTFFIVLETDCSDWYFYYMIISNITIQNKH